MLSSAVNLPHSMFGSSSHVTSRNPCGCEDVLSKLRNDKIAFSVPSVYMPTPAFRPRRVRDGCAATELVGISNVIVDCGNYMYHYYVV
jgi:hypothetical protein